MALTKLTFKPGINKDITNYSQEGGWYDGDKIRFRQGFPEKIGGWEVQNFTQYQGSARSLFSYSTLLGDQIFGIGTNLKMYAFAGTSIYDITPIRASFTSATSPSTTNCIATTNTSNVVTFNLAGHGGIDGDFVTVSGAAAVGGIPAGELNAEHIITYINAKWK